MKKKKSFFERLTGSVNVGNEEDTSDERDIESYDENQNEENEEGQLTVDIYQTPEYIIVKAMVAGVKEPDLDISITQDMLTIHGHREKKEEISKENYYYQELYWGSFSRSILLPQEVDADKADASMKDGILTVKLPKLDKKRVQKIKVN